MRKQWRQALQDMVALHEVVNRAALEESVANLKPAILLLDLAFPRLGGLESVPAIHELSPATKIVLVTGTPDDLAGLAALKAGARGYCQRDLPPLLLKKAIEKIHEGEIWVGRRVIPHLLDALVSLAESRPPDPRENPGRHLLRLSSRQREIADLIGAGASNKEIATRLHVTEGTVKAHLTAIFRKLGVPDRLRLALFVAGHARKNA